MVERMRRLRVRPSQPDLRGPRETPPGPTTWVRPATGWWKRMNAGESPRKSRAFRMGAPVRFQKAVSGSKENAAVERRKARRSASWTGSSLPLEGPARPRGGPTGCGVPHQRLSALRSLREQGRRSFDICPPVVSHVNPMITHERFECVVFTVSLSVVMPRLDRGIHDETQRALALHQICRR
jgi:hypothetical protein